MTPEDKGANGQLSRIVVLLSRVYNYDMKMNLILRKNRCRKKCCEEKFD